MTHGLKLPVLQEPAGVKISLTPPYLDGVYLAVNAIPDAYLIYDAHDCGYYKAEKIAANHDLFSDLLRWEPMKRVVRTNLDNREFIMGSEDKLSMKVRQVAARYRVSLLVIARSNIVAAIGGENPAVLRELRERTALPIVDLTSRGLGGDHVSGYFDTLEAVCAAIPPPDEVDGDELWLVGHYLHRTEGDQEGDAEELRRLVAAVHGRSPAVLLDGSPFASWAQRSRPTTVLSHQASGEAGARLAQRFGARHASLHIPLGLEATVRYVRELGRLLGAEERATSFVDRELSALVPRLEWIVPRFFLGRRTFVFADRRYLAPLVRCYEELGCEVVAVGCLSGGERPAPSLPELGLDEKRHRQLPLDQVALRELFTRESREKERPLVIGNTTIVQFCADLPVAAVELGYPSSTYHALTPRPVLGFAGVRTLVERSINAIARSELAGSVR